MSRYAVPLQMTLSTVIEVEADSPEDAAVKVWDTDEAQDGLTGICAQCSGWGRRVNIDSGEWDVAEDVEPWLVEPKT